MMQAWLAKQRTRSLGARCLMLTIVVVCTYIVAAPIGYSMRGRESLYAGAVAAGACWLGAGVALVISHCFRKPEFAFPGFLLGMMFRMGLPLGVAVTCDMQDGYLSKAGILQYFLAFYPVTLLAETTLSLPVGGNRKPPQGADS